MSLLNIGGENAGDAFYRYKMPKLVTKIEGRGNGIKTNVVNNVDVAKALARPPEYVLKYFGCELGAQTKYDKGSGTSIVNGAHDAAKLSQLLETFIKKYVQCYDCGNPETVVKIKRENIYLKCKACGSVSEVDPRLRLNGFILKNPPENKLSEEEKKIKKAEKERLKGLEGALSGKDEKKKKKKSTSKKSSKGEEGAANGGGDEDHASKEFTSKPEASGDTGDVNDEEEDDEDEEDEVVWMTDTSEAAMKQRAAEQLSTATAAMVTQGNIEAERQAALRREEKRLAEEAQAKEKAKAEAEAEKRLSEEAAKLKMKECNTQYSKLKSMIEGGASPDQVNNELKSIEGGRAAKIKALYMVLFGSLGKSEHLTPLLSKNLKYLLPHASDAAGQLSQLVAFEYLVGVELKDHIREVPRVLKVMYDADLAEEDVMIAWYEKGNAGAVLDVPPSVGKTIREAAQPFIAWLEEADDDEEEEEDEE
jgi:translation initiation factor 5